MTNVKTTGISESDHELLSAYVDRQLAAAERLRLERRLAAEPALRAELEDLQATVGLLRDLPPARPPRSFTLDPAAPPRRSWLAAFSLQRRLQLGGGLASAALVVLLGLQLSLGQASVATTPGQPTAAAAAIAQEQAVKEPAATVAPAMAAPAMEAAPAAAGPAGVAGMGGPPEIDATIAAAQGQAPPVSDPAVRESADVIGATESSSPDTAVLATPGAGGDGTFQPPVAIDGPGNMAGGGPGVPVIGQPTGPPASLPIWLFVAAAILPLGLFAAAWIVGRRRE